MGASTSKPIEAEIKAICEVYTLFGCKECCPQCSENSDALNRLKAKTFNILNTFYVDDEQLIRIIKEFSPENYFDSLDDLFNYSCRRVRELYEEDPAQATIIFSKFMQRYSDDVEEWTRLLGRNVSYRLSLPEPLPRNIVVFEEILRKQHTMLANLGCTVWTGETLHDALENEILAGAIGYAVDKVPGQW